MATPFQSFNRQAPLPVSTTPPPLLRDSLQLSSQLLSPNTLLDNDETLPQNMVKESMVSRLLFALKSPLQLFSHDKDTMITTAHKDTHGNAIRLTREAAIGFENILAIAKQRGIRVKVVSSYRSVEKQEYLWEQALKKYGSESKARKWVAPPGKSRHNYGKAIDMHMERNGQKVSQEEFDTIIAQAGMYRPMSWEGWHVEPLSTKKDRGQTHTHSG